MGRSQSIFLLGLHLGKLWCLGQHGDKYIKNCSLGIYGFGRFGRGVFGGVLFRESSEFVVVLMNVVTPPETLSHLLQYDSATGKFNPLPK